MYSPMLFLAQDGSSTSTTGGGGPFLGGLIDRMNIILRPDELIDQLMQVPLILAAVVVAVGILCVFNGYRWHKWIVAILAFFCGLWLGYIFSQRMGRSTVVAVSVGGLCAIVATPLLRITVAIFGGLTGAFIGSNAWTALHANPPDASWAGAFIGFIVLAMASVILFRLVVVLFTSVGGAAMAICGGIALMLQVPAWQGAVRESLTANEMLIPILLLLAAVSGFVLQEASLRASGVKILQPEGRGDD
ncbi:MAG: hypothetical protein SYC29_00295 [Planctomycetota bacterium]|nr:hypothetical protein [Planctomycetota bacterium]